MGLELQAGARVLLTRHSGTRRRQALLLGMLLGSVALPAWAADINVADEAQLRTAILNANNGDRIIFTNNITLTGPGGGDLPAIQKNITILGGENTLSGGGAFRGLFVYSGNVRIEDLAVTNAVAKGGNGVQNGGGGAGLGGALFVNAGANVTLSNVGLQTNSASGGNAAPGGVGGAGGGMGGNGGVNTGGGGGVGVFSSSGGGANGGSGASGTAGIVTGQASGGSSPGGGSGGASGGGGGGGVGPADGGGGGGVGGANAAGTSGGAGGFGGGGGGPTGTSTGGAGGFGGGGGGAGSFAGAGGFGGGGGGATSSGGGAGGFGGGNGILNPATGSGGGGAGMGGAIFVVEGGTLILEGNLSVNGGTVTGGAGGGGNPGGAGSGFGSGLFLQGNGTLTFQPGVGSTQTISDVIADQTGSGGTGTNNFATGGPTCTTGVGCGSYSGAGSWGLNMNGAGTLVLAGANTYSGPTTVNAGTLLVNGALTNSNTTVTAGTFGGTGSVRNVTVNGGTFAPGSGAPGSSMTVNGNLAFASAATYLVQLNAATASIANVSGTATLAGTVQAQFAPGSIVSQQYTILHSAGLGGTRFDASTTNLPAGFAADLSYSNTDVLLTLSAALGAGGGLNGNQQNVANALNNFFNNGGTLPPNFGTIFSLSGASLANALSQLSGEAATGAQQSAFQLGNQFLGLMLDPFVDGRGGPGSGGALGFAPEREALPADVALAYAKLTKAPVYKAAPLAAYEPRWTAWGSAFGGYNKTNGDAVLGTHDLTARVGGVAAGLDYRIAPGTVVGFALAGGGTKWDLAQGLGGGRSDAFQAGVYGATRSGPAYLAASFAFSNHWMSTDRLAPFFDRLTADFEAQSFGGRVEGGYRFGAPGFGITPYAAVQAQSFHTPTYSEIDATNGGFGLTYDSRNAHDVRSELGARFDHVALVDRGAVLTLRGRLAWAHDWVSDPSLAAVFQTLPGASFIVNGALPVKDAALASAGAELKLANGVTLLGKFDGEFAGRSNTYAGTGTLRVNW